MELVMLQTPIGISDFRKLIESRDPEGNPLLFVDKSLFIKAILDDLSEVKLFTRPRRFGKTLNMSMLYHFLAPEVDGKSTQSLFKHLKISEYKEYLERYQGKFQVIYMTFKSVTRETHFEAAYKRLCKEISKVYMNYHYLLESPKLGSYQKEVFKSILEERATLASVKASLSDLTHALYLHHGTRPWVLIDEYDTPIQTAYLAGYYREAVDFMKGFLGAGLKDNSYLEKAVLTGILRISKESIFSGLNNVSVYSLLSPEYGEYFGFTEPEVNDLLEKSKLSQNTADVKAWYNGYQAGNTVIYNPWSIINYINKNGLLNPYWVNVSDNIIIKDLLIKSSIDFKSQFENLLQNNFVERPVDENIVFEQLETSDSALWTLLVMSGYLKTKIIQRPGQTPLYQLEIPNREVREFYQKTIFEWLLGTGDATRFKAFVNDLLCGNMEKFESNLQKIMLQTFSIYDIKGKEPEKFFHGFMLGLVAGLEPTQYQIHSNKENGLGRFDIAIIPKDLSSLGIIIEVKSIEKNEPESLKVAAKNALQQIDEKIYSAALLQHQIQSCLKIGVAFSGKNLAVEHKTDTIAL